mmetsp:Transcript_31944/g.58547  ORF Transcript_31944/g.58547 Transcript_31944/m.58547 type:complete len:201 (-) Transcript_31944:161-763(-)
MDDVDDVDAVVLATALLATTPILLRSSMASFWLSINRIDSSMLSLASTAAVSSPKLRNPPSALFIIEMPPSPPSKSDLVGRYPLTLILRISRPMTSADLRRSSTPSNVRANAWSSIWDRSSSADRRCSSRSFSRLDWSIVCRIMAMMDWRDATSESSSAYAEYRGTTLFPTTLPLLELTYRPIKPSCSSSSSSVRSPPSP